MYEIDLVLVIPLIFMSLAIFGTYFNAVNWFTGLLAVITGFGISYWLSPVSTLVIIPLKNSLWFGYAWGLTEYLAGALVITWIAGAIIGMYNLYMSNGKTLWG